MVKENEDSRYEIDLKHDHVEDSTNVSKECKVCNWYLSFKLLFFLYTLQVSVFAEEHFLDALCLQHLLSQLAGDNLSLYFNDYTDQVLDSESSCVVSDHL